MFKSISVIGLGYIGIPTSVFFAKTGLQVVGVDINENIVNQLNSGYLTILEPNLENLLKQVVDMNKFRATTKPETTDAYIIAVPTPFKENHEPDLKYIKSAAKSISNCLQRGNLIVLESTSPVGTTESLAQWLQELRPDLNILNDDVEKDVFVAYCPERMIPGNVFELVENDRIVGGINEESTYKAKELYSLISEGELLLTDSKTAEMSKLTENSFRDVNIAFANELSIICEKKNINVHKLIEIANHHPRVNILQPGCGVGGHCIAVDPWFIVSSDRENSKLISTARIVNDFKPKFVVQKVEDIVNILGKNNPTICCFGASFKPNIDDLRESPALKICEELSSKYKNVLLVEPNIREIPDNLKKNNVKLVSLDYGIKADIIVPLVKHKDFLGIKPKFLKKQCIVDVLGVWCDE